MGRSIMGWMRRLAVGGLLLLLWAFSAWRRQLGRPLLDPPYCAWRFVSNFRSYNVAFPDSRSIYHVSLMHLGPGDEIKITADSLPYARYFSYQSYSIPDFVSIASLRDFEIVTDASGPNCYANLTAAVNGEKQGGYTLFITAHGDKNYTNELRALPDDHDSGYFIIFLRIYQDGDGAPHPDVDPVAACYGLHETPQEWAWACPPEMAVKRAGRGFQKLPFCRYRRKYGIRYNDITRPVQECPHAPNQQHSFFLPSPFYLTGKFANRDAKYLFSCAIKPQPAAAAEPELWARVTGVLPRTAHSLYAPPFIANVTDYEVRYVSLSSVGRSLPYKGFHTLPDSMIARHFHEREGASWNRTFVVWLGPPDAAKPAPPEVEQDGGLFMPWGSSILSGKQIPYPGVLYRQILSRAQVLGSESGGARTSGNAAVGLADIIPQACAWEQEEEGGGGREGSAAPPMCRGQDQQQQQQHAGAKGQGQVQGRDGGSGPDLHSWLERELCCGRDAPEWCFLPRYLAAKMQDYYPRIEYFVRPAGTNRLARVGGEAGGRNALRPLVSASGSGEAGGEGGKASGGMAASVKALASKLLDLVNVGLWFS